jgi:hypothetical protein
MDIRGVWWPRPSNPKLPSISIRDDAIIKMFVQEMKNRIRKCGLASPRKNSHLLQSYSGWGYNIKVGLKKV